MNMHKNARLTYARRIELVKGITERGLSVGAVAAEQGVSAATARKWLGRYLALGQGGLIDRSSRPAVSPRALSEGKALAIVELRRKRLTQARIARALGVSGSTVSRVLRRAGLSRLSDLDPVEPIVRYEHERAGDLIHLDTKKLMRIERPGHRATGSRAGQARGAGWEALFVAIDDHARIGFTEIYPNERAHSAWQFLRNLVAHFKGLGVTVRGVLTDNGMCFRSHLFRRYCMRLGIRHQFTRPYRPQTNGKAERFIQSALREWAYAYVYQHSSQRAEVLDQWIHHYNWHRPHHGIGRVAPMSRLVASENNLLTLHS